MYDRHRVFEASPEARGTTSECGSDSDLLPYFCCHTAIGQIVEREHAVQVRGFVNTIFRNKQDGGLEKGISGVDFAGTSIQ